MKTSELIDQLSRDLEARKSADSFLRFAWLCLLGALLILAICAAIFPLRSDLSNELSHWRYFAEGFLWLVSAVFCMRVAYLSSIPGLSLRRAEWAASISFALLIALVVSRVEFGTVGQDVMREMELARGYCGPLIFAIGGLAIAGLFYWAKRHAPVRYARTGFWAAAASGMLGAFAMHLICAHESAVHVEIWHVLPVIALALVGSQLGKKTLRW